MYKNKILSLFLCVVVMLFFTFKYSSDASIKSSLENKIKKNDEKIDSVKTEIKDMQGEIDVLNDELSKLKLEIDQRNSIVNEYSKNIDEHQGMIDEKNLLIQGVLKEIENSEKNIEELNVKLELNNNELRALEKILFDRIKEFYKYSQSNSMGLDLLFAMVFDMNKDIQDLTDTLHSVSKITESDRKLIENVKQKRDEISRSKTNLENEIKNLGLYKLDLEKQIAEVEALKEKLVVKKQELENEVKEVEKLQDSYKEKYDNLDEDVRKKREELIRIQQDNEDLEKQLSEYINSINNGGSVGGNNKVSPSGYLRPSTGPVTSSYGWRTHPIRRSKSFHSGTDFGGSIGDIIVSSRAGDVAFAGWYNNVYGNVVILNHGGGYQTFYAHMSRVAVSTGQVVDQGQKIGYMGSTGLSTGAHLHFEVRKDGSTLNPLNFLSR